MRASEKAAAAHTKKRRGERRSGEEEGWRKSREVVGKLQCEERESHGGMLWSRKEQILLPSSITCYLFVTIAATFPVISKTFCFLCSSIHPILISFTGTE